MAHIKERTTDENKQDLDDGKWTEYHECFSKEGARDLLELELRNTASPEYTAEVLKQWDTYGEAFIRNCTNPDNCPHAVCSWDYYTYED